MKFGVRKLESLGYQMLACCCPSMNDEDAALARKQTDGENEDDSGARILTRRFCHRYDRYDMSPVLVPDGEEIMTLAFFVLTQYWLATDGRTDGQTDMLWSLLPALA